MFRQIITKLVRLAGPGMLAILFALFGQAAAANAATVHVSGAVQTTGGGGPVPGVTVTFTDEIAATNAAITTTDQAGDYQVDIPTGLYDVSFTPPNSSYQPTTLAGQSITADTVINVLLVPASPPTHTVSGVITQGNGSPVAGALVTLSDGPTVSSAADGSYSIPVNCAACNLQILGMSEGNPFRATIANLLVATDITYNVAVPQLSNVSVHTVGSDGLNVANVHIAGLNNASLYTNTTNATASFMMQLPLFTTDTNGNGSIQGFEGASLSATATPPTNSGYSPADFSFTVADGSSQTITLTKLPPTFTISGRVTQGNGSPVAGGLVTLNGGSTVSTAADGSYVLSANCGSCSLQILGMSEGAPFRLSSITFSVTSNYTFNVAVPRLSVMAIHTVGSDGPGVANVRLTDPGSASYLATSTNTAAGGFYMQLPIVTTNSNGDGSIQGFEGANFSATATPPVSSGYAAANANFTVADGSSQTITLTKLPPTFTISGRVTQGNGSPVAGALVTLNGGPTVSTAANGSYSVPVNCATCSLQILGMSEGHPFLFGSVNIFVAGNVTYNVAVPSLSNVTFHAIAPDGSALPGVRISGPQAFSEISTSTVTAEGSFLMHVPGATSNVAGDAVIQGFEGSVVSVLATPPASTSYIAAAFSFTVVNGSTQVLRFVPPTPAAPVGLVAPTPTNAAPALTWQAVSGVAGYRVYRNGTQVGSVTAPAFIDANLTADGSYQYTVTAINSGNGESPSSAPFTVIYDTTPPTVDNPTWSTDPLAVGGNTTLTAPAGDARTSVTAGEYFIGADPGAGQGMPMTYGPGNLTATFGSSLGVGVYDIGLRAKDAAGNWSFPTSTMLVVYDPATTLGVTGKNKKDLVPSLAAGDVMPGLIAGNQTDTADYGLTVQYKNGALDPKNDFHFTYTTGTKCGKSGAQNCHSFTLDATSFSWLVVDQSNNSRGQLQGLATVTVDGVVTTNPFIVSSIDGNRLTPQADDTLLLKVFAPGADPSSATPLYRASGTMAKGNSVKIQ